MQNRNAITKTEEELIGNQATLWHIYDRLEHEIAFYSVQKDKEEKTMWKEMYTKQIEAIKTEAEVIKYAIDLVEEKLDEVRSKDGFGVLIGLIGYNKGKYEIFDSLNDLSVETDDMERAKLEAGMLIDNYEARIEAPRYDLTIHGGE